MDGVTIVLHKPSGDTFSKWLTMYAEGARNRWEESGDVSVLVEYDSRIDDWVFADPPDDLPDWMHRVTVWVTLGDPLEEAYTRITFDTYPLNFATSREGIQVTARYEPCNELPEMRGYFEELLKAVAQAWPQASSQLVKQGVSQGAGGPDQEADGVTTDEQPTSDEYVFRRSGDYWEITYQGDSFPMHHLVGLAYIHCLLERPHTDVSVTELEAAIQGVPPESASKMYHETYATDSDEGAVFNDNYNYPLTTIRNAH